jgi:hypothetical protein
MDDLLERANRWLRRRQERAIGECKAEVSALRQGRRALTTRLGLLAKVSALVGHDLEELLPKIAELSIPSSPIGRRSTCWKTVKRDASTSRIAIRTRTTSPRS